MPRTPPARPEAASETHANLDRVNAVLASAAQLTGKNMLRPRTTGGNTDWQNEAWYFYDCVDDQTQILTPAGWVTHDQLTPGVLVRTIDHDTGTTGWEPVQHVVRHDVVDRAMLSMEMRHHSSLTTLGHRWPVLRMGYRAAENRRGTVRTGRCREWATSETLAAEDQIITAAPARDLPQVAKYDDALVELVGWFWTEGSVRSDRLTPSVRITQSTIHNPTHCASIEAALTAHCPDGWSKWVNPRSGVASYQLHTWASGAILDAAPDKRVGYDFLLSLTAAQLLLFLDVSMRADGHNGKVIGQKYRDMLERYEFACILAGRTPHITDETTGDRSLLFDLAGSTASPRTRHRATTTYTGTIWCPVTASKSWLARRNGTVFYTGNCIGEFRFGVNWKAHALSQCTLAIEEETAEGFIRVTDPNAPENVALQMLFGGDAGQSQALSSMTLHLEVAGETYLVGETMDEDGRPDPNGVDTWTIYSNEEIQEKNAGGPGAPASWELDRGDGRKRVVTEDNAWVIRLWHSHPRKWVEADSPARAAIPILREIEQLTKHVAAQVDSRLAGAGVLFVPTEMTFSAGATIGGGVVQTEGELNPLAEPDAQGQVNKFVVDLTQAMTLPIANRDHPSALVPVIVKAPGAMIANVKHITFDSPLDKKSLELRKEGIGRLAATADMPGDIILGIGDVNHWTSWQLEESAIKIHIEPLGETMTSGLSQRFLRLAVRALGAVYNPKRRIVLDTANLRLRPDRSTQAQWLYDHLELSGEALLRETGFDVGDAPKPEDIKVALLKRLATGTASPELVNAAVQAMFMGGNTLGPVEVAQPAAIGPGSGGTGSDPVPPERDRQPPEDTGPPGPESPPAAAASAVGVFVSAELLVKRAVERANNRINRRAKIRKAIPKDQLDAALAGAWDDVPHAAELLGVDPAWFTDRLDAYTRGVLTTGEEHQPRILDRVLGSS